MSRLFVTAVAALALLAVAAPANTARPGGITATFTVHFPKGHPGSNAPCDPDAFCGIGTLAGYGAATITILDETFDPIDGSSCLATTRVEEIDLSDGSGSLALDSAGTFCRPGGSGDSHASSSSYGSPGRWDLRFIVDGPESTGVFAGATGTGVETMNVAGGVGVWHLRGGIAG